MTRGWGSSREKPQYGWANSAEISSEVAGTLWRLTVFWKTRTVGNFLHHRRLAPYAHKHFLPPQHMAVISPSLRLTCTVLGLAQIPRGTAAPRPSLTPSSWMSNVLHCEQGRAGLPVGESWESDLEDRSEPWGNSTAWRRGGRFTTFQIDSRKSKVFVCLFVWLRFKYLEGSHVTNWQLLTSWAFKK